MAVEKKSPGGRLRGGRARGGDLADLKRRVARVEAELAELRRVRAEARAAEDADDVAATRAAMADGPGRPYAEARADLGLA